MEEEKIQQEKIHQMKQKAPYPVTLDTLLKRLNYKEGWRFMLADIDRCQGSEGLTLIIRLDCKNAYKPDQPFQVVHYMLVPAAAYDERAWCRWLLDQILLVEQHEACEFFTIDGNHVFAPNHAPGRNPYSIMEYGTQEDALTDFRGQRFELETK